MLAAIKALLRGSNRDHAEGCWDWGPHHYECAQKAVRMWRQELKEAADSLWSCRKAGNEKLARAHAERLYELLDYPLNDQVSSQRRIVPQVAQKLQTL